MRRMLPALSLSLVVCAGLAAQGSRNMTLLSKIPHSPCTTGDVWAIGDYMLLAARSQGFEVVDARDPKNPKVKKVFPPGYPISNVRSYGVGDIKADGRYIYATNEGTRAGGVFVFDAKDPMNPRYLATAGSGRGSVHNCWVDPDRKRLFTNRGAIYDVSSPSSPKLLNRLGVGFSHDVIVLEDRAYYSLWSSGIGIWDVSNPAQPRLLGRKSYAGARTHNMWPTEDRRYLFTTDETANGGMRIWDISKLPTITQVGTWNTGAPGESIHNVQVSGELLFVSYYKSGLRVLSIKDPTKPVEIAYYDTYPSAGRGCFGGPYAGCWGVYPWNLDKVFVSDLDSGGYILSLDVVPGTFTAKSTTVKPGTTLEMDFAYRNAAGTPLNGFGVVILSSVNGAPEVFPLLQEIKVLGVNQSVPHKFRIPVPPGLPSVNVGFTAYSGTFAPLLVSDQRDLAISIR